MIELKQQNKDFIKSIQKLKFWGKNLKIKVEKKNIF